MLCFLTLTVYSNDEKCSSDDPDCANEDDHPDESTKYTKGKHVFYIETCPKLVGLKMSHSM